jgi:hypothetical protein
MWGLQLAGCFLSELLMYLPALVPCSGVMSSYLGGFEVIQPNVNRELLVKVAVKVDAIVPI